MEVGVAVVLAAGLSGERIGEACDLIGQALFPAKVQMDAALDEFSAVYAPENRSLVVMITHGDEGDHLRAIDIDAVERRYFGGVTMEAAAKAIAADAAEGHDRFVRMFEQWDADQGAVKARVREVVRAVVPAGVWPAEERSTAMVTERDYEGFEKEQGTSGEQVGRRLERPVEPEPEPDAPVTYTRQPGQADAPPASGPDRQFSYPEPEAEA